MHKREESIAKGGKYKPKIRGYLPEDARVRDQRRRPGRSSRPRRRWSSRTSACPECRVARHPGHPSPSHLARRSPHDHTNLIVLSKPSLMQERKLESWFPKKRKKLRKQQNTQYQKILIRLKIVMLKISKHNKVKEV